MRKHFSHSIRYTVLDAPTLLKLHHWHGVEFLIVFPPTCQVRRLVVILHISEGTLRKYFISLAVKDKTARWRYLDGLVVPTS